MDRNLKNIFFRLLRIGLWKSENLGNDIRLTVEEWDFIYKYAIKHTVEAVLYESFSYLTEDQLPPYHLILKWTARVDKIERQNLEMNIIIAQQYSFFLENGLSPILQKGQGIARSYEEPLHRISGDIDWYFENNGYSKARSLIKERNCNLIDSAGFSLIYQWQNIDVEHHKKLFDIRSPLKYRYLKKLEHDNRMNYRNIKINDVTIPILSPELQMLQVNGHILKHLISFGIGIRQLCDSAKLYAYYRNEIDPSTLKIIYKKTGILKWTHLLHRILVEQIGLPQEYIPYEFPKDTNANWMLEEIWYGGNFGYYDERYAEGKVNSTVSMHPDGAKRLWQNFKRYLPYAPQEAIFFPIMHLYSKFLGIDRD